MTISAARAKLNAARDIEMAQLSVTGHSYDDIAKRFNLTQPRVSQILSKPAIRDIVDTGTNQIVSFIPLAISRFFAVLNDPDNSDHYKAVKDTLQMTGILPSHTGAVTYIQNVYNDNRLGTEADVTRFTELVQLRQDQDIVEADYTDDTINIEGLD